MVGLSRRPTRGGRLVGGYGPIRSPVPAGGGTLSSPSGTPVWFTVPHEATACLHVPAKTWVLCPLTQVSDGPCASQLCRAPPHWMLFPPDAIPSNGCSGLGAGQGDCGQVSCSQCYLSFTFIPLQAWVALPTFCAMGPGGDTLVVNEARLCAMEKPGGRSLSGGLMHLLGLALLPESCLLLGLLWDPCTRLLGTPTC